MFSRKSNEFVREYREMCAVQYAQDPRISDVASRLVLARAGVGLGEEELIVLANKLGDIADELKLHPEDVNAALLHNEPILREKPLAL